MRIREVRSVLCWGSCRERQGFGVGKKQNRMQEEWMSKQRLEETGENAVERAVTMVYRNVHRGSLCKIPGDEKKTLGTDH